MSFDPLRELRGVVTVLNTPFDAEGRVAPEALAANVRYAIESGAAGFLVPAMASEVGSLDPGERRLVVRTVLEAAERRVPVVGGASAPGRPERRERAAELLGLGCPCVLASLSWTGSKEEYFADIADLAGLDPPCLMVQDWDASGQGAPVEVILEAFGRFPAFKAIKVETVPAGPKYSALIAGSSGALHVSGGWAVGQMIEALDRGVHAFMPTGLHGAYSRIHALHRAGKRAAALALFERILPILAFSNQQLEISILFWKRMLWRQGLYPTPEVRATRLRLDPYQERVADELIERGMEIERELAALPGGEGAAARDRASDRED